MKTKKQIEREIKRLIYVKNDYIKEFNSRQIECIENKIESLKWVLK